MKKIAIEVRSGTTRLLPRTSVMRRWVNRRAGGPTADCDDIDPYARHRHTSRCGYALIHGSEARQADDYQSALW
jgi:hypothetical protein